MRADPHTFNQTFLFSTIKGLDKSCVSRTIDNIVEGLYEKRNEFIKWPTDPNISNRIKREFYEVAGFPNVLGAIDGTHVRIKKPSQNEANYVNRKHYHSINVQAVCDVKGKYYVSSFIFPSLRQCQQKLVLQIKVNQWPIVCSNILLSF